MAEGYKDWSAGEILTAADLEDYTVKQSVMRFDDSSARTTSLSGVLAEGMMSYLKDTDSVEVYDGSAWAAVGGGKILQVVSTTKTDTFTTSASSFTDITGLSVSITPSAATSKVFVIATIQGNADAGSNIGYFQLVRDSTAIAIGDVAGSRSRVSAGIYEADPDSIHTAAITYLDAPATTSATTYKIQGYSNSTTTLYVNRSKNDSDSAGFGRAVSTITAVEVSA